MQTTEQQYNKMWEKNYKRTNDITELLEVCRGNGSGERRKGSTLTAAIQNKSHEKFLNLFQFANNISVIAVSRPQLPQH